VAQAADLSCRIVYVDNDPLVMAHARALLKSTPEGSTAYLHADLREPDATLDAAKSSLDFGQPVGLMLLGVVNHIVDDEQAYGSVARLVSALAPGSMMVLTHSTAEVHGSGCCG
jgi:hypothetical protein